MTGRIIGDSTIDNGGGVGVSVPGDAVPSSAPAPTVRRRRRGSRRRAATGLAWTLGGLFLLVAAWEIASLVVADSVLLPGPILTAKTWWYYMTHNFPTAGEPLWRDALTSLGRIAIGFSGGATVGVLLAALMVSSYKARRLIDPIIELTRPLPPLAFIPVLILWFGIGETSKVVLIGFGVVPLMVLSTVTALDKVPLELTNAARSLGASQIHTMIHVRIRAALPYVITGMRISMGNAWTSIIAAEMIAATSGLGYVILQAGNYLRMDLIFAGIVTIAMLGVAIDLVLRLVERFVDPTARRPV